MAHPWDLTGVTIRLRQTCRVTARGLDNQQIEQYDPSRGQRCPPPQNAFEHLLTTTSMRSQRRVHRVGKAGVQTHQ